MEYCDLENDIFYVKYLKLVQDIPVARIFFLFFLLCVYMSWTGAPGVSWYLMGDKTHRFVCRPQIHVTPTDDAVDLDL